MSQDSPQMQGKYVVTCRKPNGEIRWKKETKNLIVNTGLAYLSSVGLANGTKIYPWYIGLTGNSPTPAAGDTMASHGGWSEVVAYSQAARPSFVGSQSGVGVTNVTAATFTVSADATAVGGLFLSSVATKSSASGTLFSIAAFTDGNETANTGDAISVTYTMTPSAG